MDKSEDDQPIAAVVGAVSVLLNYAARIQDWDRLAAAHISSAVIHRKLANGNSSARPVTGLTVRERLLRGGKPTSVVVWGTRVSHSREGTCWRHIPQTLVVYRLIDPGSEWRLHRLWFEHSAMCAPQLLRPLRALRKS